MTEYRASFDATVTFANGGGLAVHGFRVDVPDPGIDEAGIAALFVASLGLLMTESVSLSNHLCCQQSTSAASRFAWLARTRRPMVTVSPGSRARPRAGRS
ncbi:MAG TPA: hypothetical protein VF933_13770 [Streptosporangiaceae bacterium]